MKRRKYIVFVTIDGKAYRVEIEAYTPQLAAEKALTIYGVDDATAEVFGAPLYSTVE